MRPSTAAELWLRPLAAELEHLPGQYVLLEDGNLTVMPRSYSVANARHPDGLFSLLVTHVPCGQASTWIHDRLRVGDVVSVSGPCGWFLDDPASTAPSLYLAVGSGLTPIGALLEAALAGGAHAELTLVFSARTDDDVLDRKRFAGIDVRHPRSRVRPHPHPHRWSASAPPHPGGAGAPVRSAR